MICLLKSSSGLGFHRIADFNMALIAKWGWKILEGSDSIWAKVIRRNISKLEISWEQRVKQGILPFGRV